MGAVVVVTPVYAAPEYRGLDFLDNVIRSVQQSPSPRYVHLIVDDGSPLDVKSFVGSYNDQRIRYLRREKAVQDEKTPAAALNFAFEVCLRRPFNILRRDEAPDAFTYLHSDDMLGKDSLKLRLDALSGGIVYANTACFDGKGRISHVVRPSAGEDAEKLLSMHGALKFPHHTLMWETKFLRTASDYAMEKYGQQGVFDPSVRLNEDFDATVTTLEAAFQYNAPLRHLPIVSVFYRMHNQSITGVSSSAMQREFRKKMAQKHFNGENYLWTQMSADLPWSLFTFLPEHLKSGLRPFRKMVKDLLHQSSSVQQKEITDLEQMLNI